MIRNPNIRKEEHGDYKNMTIMDKIKNKYKHAKPKTVKKKYCPTKVNENSVNQDQTSGISPTNMRREEGKE